MFRSVRAALILAIAFGMTSCAPAPADTAADLKAIESVRNAYVAAFSDGDPDKTAAVYATDGIYMGDGSQQIIGRDAIRKHYQELMSGMDTDVQLKAEETVVNGDWAFERGQTWLHIMSKDPKSTLPMIMDQGKYLVVLKRQADRSWLIASVMSNTNIGPPPPPAPAQAK